MSGFGPLLLMLVVTMLPQDIDIFIRPARFFPSANEPSRHVDVLDCSVFLLKDRDEPVCASNLFLLAGERLGNMEPTEKLLIRLKMPGPANPYCLLGV